jgi:hypothetical protein
VTFPPFTVKPKTCAYEKCGREFIPRRPLQNVCGPVCAGRWSKAKTAANAKAEAVRTKERKRELETIPELIRKAQREFNSFIRARDAEKPCISCGGPLEQGGIGGGYDCGHFRSTGSAAHLRFDERNAAGQCKHCNRYLAGNVVAYRSGLAARIGLGDVEALEADNAPHKWTREELREIAAKYRAKLKEMKE